MADQTNFGAQILSKNRSVENLKSPAKESRNKVGLHSGCSVQSMVPLGSLPNTNQC